MSDRNLTGSHTARVDSPCTLYVEPHGDDARDGRSLAGALRSPARAVAVGRPGDVVCFGPGTYPPLVIDRVKATAAAPLVFRALPGAERQATFAVDSLSFGASVRIASSQHIHIYDLRLSRSQTGLELRSSAHCRIEGLLVEEVGQAAIHVGRKQMFPRKRFLGPASHHDDVIGNTIRDTGKVTARYGEGVYIGTGAFGGDDTHDTFIAYNRFDRVRAEAIELKPFTYNHIVRGNLVRNGSHMFHGAITVGVQSAHCRDMNSLIEDNRVFDYTSVGDSVAGISIGQGNVIVRNNVVWAVEGGRGIRTTTTFANQSARRVAVERNTVWIPGTHRSISLNDGDERTEMNDQFGDIVLRNNLTDDGSAGSTQVSANSFVGPVVGDADAGSGAGSGLRSRSYRGRGADLCRILAGAPRPKPLTRSAHVPRARN